MNRRSFLQASLGGAAALQLTAQDNKALFGLGQRYEGAPAGHEAPEPSPPARPNVIWIFGDQLRAQALSFNGDPNARTPSLERAEVNGMNFTHNISGFPLCCPFRGSLLTSRYPNHCVPGHE